MEQACVKTEDGLKQLQKVNTKFLYLVSCFFFFQAISFFLSNSKHFLAYGMKTVNNDQSEIIGIIIICSGISSRNYFKDLFKFLMKAKL